MWWRLDAGTREVEKIRAEEPKHDGRWTGAEVGVEEERNCSWRSTRHLSRKLPRSQAMHLHHLLLCRSVENPTPPTLGPVLTYCNKPGVQH